MKARAETCTCGRSRSMRRDSVGVALSQIPKWQRPGPMVQVANRRWPERDAQDHDRGAGTPAHRPLTARQHKRGAERASSYEPHRERQHGKGGRTAQPTHGFRASCENGPATPEPLPPMRITGFRSRPDRPTTRSVARMSAPDGKLPSGFVFALRRGSPNGLNLVRRRTRNRQEQVAWACAQPSRPLRGTN